eukprot:6453227-Amphidinium_carterae.1
MTQSTSFPPVGNRFDTIGNQRRFRCPPGASVLQWTFTMQRKDGSQVPKPWQILSLAFILETIAAKVGRIESTERGFDVEQSGHQSFSSLCFQLQLQMHGTVSNHLSPHYDAQCSKRSMNKT